MCRHAIPWGDRVDAACGPAHGADIGRLLEAAHQRGVISFAGAMPAPELFPLEELRAAFDTVLREDGPGCLQYGPTRGHAPLRQHIAERLQRRGIACEAGQVLITTGSQQALDLLGRVLIGPGMPVLVEAPGYVGALEAFAARRPRFVPLPLDEHGPRVEAAEHLPIGQPALLYSVPTFQNPTGSTMSLQRRRDLLAWARERGVPIVEDDPYSDLRYEGPELPPLRALPDGDEVIHLGTFSKVLAPGLRIGWMVAPPPIMERLALAKQGSDMHTDSLAQRAVLRYCLDNDLGEHVRRLSAAYRERRDAMLAALGSAGLAHTHPKGGMHTWVTLPAGVDSVRLLDAAVQRGVAFMPGAAFHADGRGAGHLRMSFSGHPPNVIDRGVRKLAGMLAANWLSVP